MNPLAALLASLTGAAPGQATAAASEGEGGDLFAGLLAALNGGDASGEALLSGATGAPAGGGGASGAFPGNLLLTFDAETGLWSFANAEAGLADGQGGSGGLPADPTAAHTPEDLLGLLSGTPVPPGALVPIKTQAANATASETDTPAADPLAAATGEGLSSDGDATGLTVIDPNAPAADAGEATKEDDPDSPDPLSVIAAGVAPRAVAETPAEGQAADPSGDETIKVDTPGDAAPAPAGGPAADANAAPQAQPNASAAAGDKPAPAPANAPTPQPHHTAPTHGAPPPGAGAPQTAADPDTHAASAQDGADLAADFDQALDATTEATRPSSNGRPQGAVSLDSLLTATRPQPGDGHPPVTPAAGAADTGSLPQQLRPAAPAVPSLPPVPVAAVAVTIAQQASAGAKRFEIRLEPPELGRIEVRLDVSREGHATTHLVVERSETLDMLQRDARHLERALQNAGLNTSDSDLTFSLKDQGAFHQGAKDNAQGQPRAAQAQANEEPVEEPWQPVPIRGLGQAGLDIRI